jgi:hypothetical protein
MVAVLSEIALFALFGREYAAAAVGAKFGVLRK